MKVYELINYLISKGTKGKDVFVRFPNGEAKKIVAFHLDYDVCGQTAVFCYARRNDDSGLVDGGVFKHLFENMEKFSVSNEVAVAMLEKDGDDGFGDYLNDTMRGVDSVEDDGESLFLVSGAPMEASAYSGWDGKSAPISALAAKDVSVKMVVSYGGRNRSEWEEAWYNIKDLINVLHNVRMLEPRPSVSLICDIGGRRWDITGELSKLLSENINYDTKDRQ